MALKFSKTKHKFEKLSEFSLLVSLTEDINVRQLITTAAVFLDAGMSLHSKKTKHVFAFTAFSLHSVTAD